jgi:hypothetical protein
MPARVYHRVIFYIFDEVSDDDTSPIFMEFDVNNHLIFYNLILHNNVLLPGGTLCFMYRDRDCFIADKNITTPRQ